MVNNIFSHNLESISCKACGGGGVKDSNEGKAFLWIGPRALSLTGLPVGNSGPVSLDKIC